MFRAHVLIIRRSKLNYTASGIITPISDEHMCSKHVEAWNKLIVKQKFCASSLLITEINILWCTVSKTSKFIISMMWETVWVQPSWSIVVKMYERSSCKNKSWPRVIQREIKRYFKKIKFYNLHFLSLPRNNLGLTFFLIIIQMCGFIVEVV